MSPEATDLIVWYLRLKLIAGPIVGAVVLAIIVTAAVWNVMGKAIGFLTLTIALAVTGVIVVAIKQLIGF